MHSFCVTNMYNISRTGILGCTSPLVGRTHSSQVASLAHGFKSQHANDGDSKSIQP